MTDSDKPQNHSADGDAPDTPEENSPESRQSDEQEPVQPDAVESKTVAQSSPEKSSPDSPKPKKKDEEDEDGDDLFSDLGDRELGGRMTFLEHLDELRRRIMYSVISILATFVLGWIFREQIFAFLSAPIKGVVDKLVVIKPTEPFTIYLKVSFTAAVFMAAPIILSQVWMFIAPGLYRKEKRFALPFLLSTTVLFLLGGSFAYYVVLPPALNFLLVEFGRDFQPMISAVDFFDFALLIIIGMGVIFQLPVLVAFLSMFGFVTPGFLWKNFRYAFLIITIIAAVVSPTTDPFNLFLWSGPMVFLYTISIGVSWIFKRRRDRSAEEA
jgi:sec-independent protein translocase protein TatC